MEKQYTRLWINGQEIGKNQLGGWSTLMDIFVTPVQ